MFTSTSVSVSKCDPAARSQTALFAVLGSLVNGIRGLTGGDEGQGKCHGAIDYPVNRPGQNVVECYTLAALIFFLLTGCFTIVLAEVFGASIGAYFLAFPLAMLLTFVSLHLLFFGFEFIYQQLKAIQFFPSSAPECLPPGVYLAFFTLVSLALMLSGNAIAMIIAIPWLFGALLNFLCVLIIFARDFFSQLKGGAE